MRIFQEVSLAVEVRKPVYECVARQIIDSKHILSLMSKVNWEVKDVMCQHSQYVDVLFRVRKIFVFSRNYVNIREYYFFYILNIKCKLRIL